MSSFKTANAGVNRSCLLPQRTCLLAFPLPWVRIHSPPYRTQTDNLLYICEVDTVNTVHNTMQTSIMGEITALRQDMKHMLKKGGGNGRKAGQLWG